MQEFEFLLLLFLKTSCKILFGIYIIIAHFISAHYYSGLFSDCDSTTTIVNLVIQHVNLNRIWLESAYQLVQLFLLNSRLFVLQHDLRII